MINKNFWKNKKVLITGHTGFKGFWMFLLLKKLGSDVYGVSIEKNSSEIYKTFSHYEKIQNEEFIDIRDVDKLENFIISFGSYSKSASWKKINSPVLISKPFLTEYPLPRLVEFVIKKS